MLGSLVALLHVRPACSGVCQSLPASSDRLDQMRILGFYRLCPAGVSVAGWKKPRQYLRLAGGVGGQREVESRGERGRDEDGYRTPAEEEEEEGEYGL